VNIDKLKKLLSDPFRVAFFHIRGEWDEEDDDRPGKMVRRRAAITIAMHKPNEDNDWIDVGISLCAPSDCFNKKIGRHIAEGRMRMRTKYKSCSFPMESYPALKNLMGNIIKVLPGHPRMRPMWYGKFLNTALANMGHDGPPGAIIKKGVLLNNAKEVKA